MFLLSRFVDYTDLGLYALAAKIGPRRHLLSAGLPGGDAPAAEEPVLQGGANAVRALDRRWSDPRLLRPRLHHLGAGDGPARAAAGRPGPAGVRRCGAADPAHGGGPHDAGAVADHARADRMARQAPRDVRRSRRSSRRATFVGTCLLLAPEMGIYAAPVAMLVGFSIPITYFFLRSQLGENRSRSRTGDRQGARGRRCDRRRLPPAAGAPGAAEALVVDRPAGLYGPLLFVLRVIPENHWPALSRMATSMSPADPTR